VYETGILSTKYMGLKHSVSISPAVWIPLNNIQLLFKRHLTSCKKRDLKIP
ncbi:hypothetical protein KIL84_005285, partial [Mauremys mutica]